MRNGFDGDFTKALNVEMRKGTSGAPSTRPLKSEAELAANIVTEQVVSMAAGFQCFDVMDGGAVPVLNTAPEPEWDINRDGLPF